MTTCSSFFSRNNKALHFFWRNNEALVFFTEEKKNHMFIKVLRQCASLSLLKKMKCLIISSDQSQAPHYFSRKKADLFWRNKEALDFFTAEKTSLAGSHYYFFRKKQVLNYFVQNDMRRLIISLERNQAPHYFFRKKNEAPHYCFRKKHWFVSKEIMMRLMFFWRNKEALHFLLKK